jgi:selenocysteine lyase/cysteine desulfurase
MTNSNTDILNDIFSSQYNSNAVIPGPYGDKLLTYADYIASAQPLRLIEAFIAEKVLPFYANTHTEASYTGWHTSHLREEARNIIKKSVHATEEDVLIFTGTGSTAAVDKMSRLLNEKSKKSGEKIIVFHGPFEHHSNVLPWRESTFEVVPIAITKNGLVDLEDLKKQLEAHQGKGTLIGSFSAASNVTGIIAPIDEITALLHNYGALSFWDYAAGAPYMKMDMNPGNGLHKDAIFISPHKFIGGTGTPGILIAKKSLFSNATPLVPSGGTVEFVTRNKHRYIKDIETREEGGTPGIIEAIRAGLCFKLKSEIGETRIDQLETHAAQLALTAFAKNPNLFILGNTDSKRLAFFAFHVRNSSRFLHYNFVIALLNDLFGIQARGGCSCAGPYGHELLDMSDEKSDQYLEELDTGNVGIKPGWSRLNLNYFVPDYEINFIIKAVNWIADNGYLLLKNYHFDDTNALWGNTNKKPIALHSLNDFTGGKSNPAPAPMVNREAIQNSYFEQADELAQQAKQEWATVPCQTYCYNQVNNPMRWYTLAQDVEM